MSESFPALPDDVTPVTATPDGACELCEAARFTHWYHEDDICWVADCEVCDTPMVVWRHHGVEPPEDHVEHMVRCLEVAGRLRFADSDHAVDRVMRQIPDHFHAHVRDPGWASRRWGSKPSRYTTVGGTRELIP